MYLRGSIKSSSANVMKISINIDNAIITNERCAADIDELKLELREIIRLKFLHLNCLLLVKH